MDETNEWLVPGSSVSWLPVKGAGLYSSGLITFNKGWSRTRALPFAKPVGPSFWH